MEHTIGDALQAMVDFQEINYRGEMNCFLGYTWGTCVTFRRDIAIRTEKVKGFVLSNIFSMYRNRPFYMSKGAMIMEELKKLSR